MPEINPILVPYSLRDKAMHNRGDSLPHAANKRERRMMVPRMERRGRDDCTNLARQNKGE